MKRSGGFPQLKEIKSVSIKPMTFVRRINEMRQVSLKKNSTL